jgi:hypothetical protein
MKKDVEPAQRSPCEISDLQSLAAKLGIPPSPKALATLETTARSLQPLEWIQLCQTLPSGSEPWRHAFMCLRFYPKSSIIRFLKQCGTHPDPAVRYTAFQLCSYMCWDDLVQEAQRDLDSDFCLVYPNGKDPSLASLALAYIHQSSEIRKSQAPTGKVTVIHTHEGSVPPKCDEVFWVSPNNLLKNVAGRQIEDSELVKLLTESNQQRRRLEIRLGLVVYESDQNNQAMLDSAIHRIESACGASKRDTLVYVFLRR